MSSINILHDIRNLSIKDGKKVVKEEYVIQGEKGLKIKYYFKDGDKKEKHTITGKDGKYVMKSIIDTDPVVEKDLDEKGLKAELKKNMFVFAKDLLKGGAKDTNDLEGGAKKRASKKAGSKKSASKKAGSKKAKK